MHMIDHRSLLHSIASPDDDRHWLVQMEAAGALEGSDRSRERAWKRRPPRFDDVEGDVPRPAGGVLVPHPSARGRGAGAILQVVRRRAFARCLCLDAWSSKKLDTSWILMMLMMCLRVLVRSGNAEQRAVCVQDHRRCLDVQCRTQSRWLCSLHSLAGRFVLVS